MKVDLKENLFKVWDTALRCVFPKHCPVCDKLIPINEEYCKCSMQENIKISNDFCFNCGYDTSRCVCSSGNTVILPAITAAYLYSGKIRADILDFKFMHRKHLAVKIGTAMAERCAEAYCDIDFDAVTFVPMSADSLEKRGYNQSKLLAQQVGKLLFVPVADLFDKTRQTLAQHDLSGEERLDNVKNSVVLKENISVIGKRILICDDVKTTGATFYQCVKVLQDAGAAKVCCISAAISDFSV